MAILREAVRVSVCIEGFQDEGLRDKNVGAFIDIMAVINPAVFKSFNAIELSMLREYITPLLDVWDNVRISQKTHKYL